MRKLGGVVAVVGMGLLAGLTLVGCTASSNEKRVIILDNGNSPFWDACRAGMQEAAKDFKLQDSGLRAVFEDNDSTPQGQLNKLRQFNSQADIAALAISAVDAKNDAIASELRKLQSKGVKVITVDSDVDRATCRDARFAFIGTDNLVGGQELGVCAKYLCPKGGGYVTFVGRTGAQNAIERIKGFSEGAGDKLKSLDSMEDKTDRPTAKDNVRQALAKHPDDLKVLVGIWSYNAPAIASVVGELPKAKRQALTVVTFDAEPGAIDAMQAGQIDAMVVQNPYEMGYQGVRLMKALIENDQGTVQKMLPNHGKPEGDIYDTGLKVVVPDDN
ncbi:MAG TPA: substrate-binding domain-containing protein, partial [Gemmataceae bacterium]|nr:substrate-binding domain-containing protein [Gemmataceae bacterium]